MSQTAIEKPSRTIELDQPLPPAIHNLHDEMIVAAMVIVFGHDEAAAKLKVAELRARFDGANEGTRNIFLNANPINIAGEILGIPASAQAGEQYTSGRNEYNEAHLPLFEKRTTEILESFDFI